ncbi:MAG TPA: hypothetical protein VHO25_12505, partial [Polyangiaceae bacterium]|nr:hypothetical protein [Polyangiaceae bacterium]
CLDRIRWGGKIKNQTSSGCRDPTWDLASCLWARGTRLCRGFLDSLSARRRNLHLLAVLFWRDRV